MSAPEPAFGPASGSAPSGAGAWIRAALALAALVGGSLYLLNLGGGREEWISDQAPLWGNLDEAAATVLLCLGVRHLFLSRPRAR